MTEKSARLIPLLMTLLVVVAVGIWAWFGLKQTPLPEGRGIITTPAGWQLYTAGSFTFYAPKGSVVRQAEKGGLVYGDVQGPNTCLRFSTGQKAAIVADKRLHPVYTEAQTAVDGRQAVLRKAVLNDNEQAEWFGDCGGPMYVGLYIPPAAPDGSAIAFEGTGRNEDVRDQIETIFKSMRLTH